MVGRPGIAPGVSPSQTARISYLPHARFYLVDMQPLFSARQIKMVGVENFEISTLAYKLVSVFYHSVVN